MGRRTKYKEEYCEAVDKYLATTGRQQQHLPKIASFAILLGVGRKTLYRWAEKHKKFRHTLEKIMKRQAEQLIDDGIYGGKEVNATIVKLMLQNNHGMKERSDLTTGDEKIEIVFHSSLKKKHE